MRLPSSHKKSIPSFLMAPIVSAAIGTNKYDWLSVEYLFLFLISLAVFNTIEYECFDRLAVACFSGPPGINVGPKYYRRHASQYDWLMALMTSHRTELKLH